MSVSETQSHRTSHEFGAEVSDLLKLVVHSLYTNKDICIRELISNASDACDKLRYLSLSDDKIKGDDNELKIKIVADKDKRTITISDNGIGMNHDELSGNLGTIARSGTRQFIDTIKQNVSSGAAGAVDLIGQFGVGFYSAFMISDKVIVHSLRAGEKQAWTWESNGEGRYTIEQNNEKHDRGTEIILHLKEGEEAYTDKFHIEHIVTTYSDYVGFPIEFQNENGEFEQINSATAIWLRSKNEIEHEHYLDFYRSVAHVGGEPWMILHNKNEGEVSYTNLLFIPAVKPFDLFHPDRKCSLKLYVNKVFITEDNVKLIPQHMRFLKGIVDSEDLPLNISRETLQQNRVINKIRVSLVKRVLNELSKRLKSSLEEYVGFWENFGAVLKEGLCEGVDTESRERLLSVCLFKTLNSGDGYYTLEQYIDNMQEGQENIFYINADNLATARNSPQVEGFVSKGLDVLLLTDSVDDFWTSVIRDYKNKVFKSVTSGDIDLDSIKKDESDDKESDDACSQVEDNDVIESAIAYFKEVLGNKVSDVRISKKLTGSPVCLAVKDGGMNIRMERFLIEQKQLPESQRSSKVMEINSKHPIVSSLVKAYSNSGASDDLADSVNLLFYQACILEGEVISDTNNFAHLISKTLEKISR